MAEDIGSQLKKLTFYLRTGAIDEVLIAYFKTERGYPVFNEHERLARYVKGSVGLPEIRDADSMSNLTLCEDQYPNGKKHPFKKIVEYLAHVGLEEQVFTYLSRFPGPFAEDIAMVCERLQMNPLNWYLNRTLGKQSGFESGQKLNHFRLAQRFRNEYGTPRRIIPSKCFHSFEDIVELERQIEQNDFLNSMLLSVASELVDRRHFKEMYRCLLTRPQLIALHDVLSQVGLESDYIFANRFEVLTSLNPDPLPTWPEFKQYLDVRRKYPYGRIFDISIKEGEVDEALNYLLEYALLIESCDYSDFARMENEAAVLVGQLLRKGASLFYRCPTSSESSLFMLLRLLSNLHVEFQVSQFSQFICCPIVYDSKLGMRLAFDRTRVHPLSCLSARRIPFSAHETELPDRLHSFAMSHRNLQVWFESEEWSPTERRCLMK